MLSGIGGCVLGVIFLGLGLFIRHRSQKGEELWRIGGGGLCHRKEPDWGWWAVLQEGAGLQVGGNEGPRRDTGI